MEEQEDLEMEPPQMEVFKLDQLQKATNNFSDDLCCGEGGFGRVYRGELADGRKIAVKRLTRGSWQGNNEFMQELRLLSELHHENLASLLGCAVSIDETCLVYEFCEGGNLNARMSTLSWRTRLQVLREISSCLDFLHNRPAPVVHRDLKSANVLLDGQNHAKLSDLGLARCLVDAATPHQTTLSTATLGYRDPDSEATGRIAPPLDVYCFGVILCEAFTGQQPFTEEHHVPDLVRRIQDHVQDTRPVNPQEIVQALKEMADKSVECGEWDDTILKELVALAWRCINSRGDNRPPINEIVQKLHELCDLAENPPAVSVPSVEAPLVSVVSVPHQEPRVCMICEVNLRNVRLPCGHQVTCQECTLQLLQHDSRCPIDRDVFATYKELTEPVYHSFHIEQLTPMAVVAHTLGPNPWGPVPAPVLCGGEPWGENVDIDALRTEAESGDIPSQARLGRCYFEEWGVDKDEDVAIQWLVPAANSNNPSARISLGHCFENGIGLEEDGKKAVELYQPLAEQGWPRAQNNLAGCHYDGTGVQASFENAAEWYTRACEQGYAEAQAWLGTMYYYGYGVPKNRQTAYDLYRISAAQGYAEAQRNMGICYQFGFGVEPNLQTAIQWFQLGAANGDQVSQNSLNDVQ